MHAHCSLTVVFGQDCDMVQGEMEARLQAAQKGRWLDPHNSCVHPISIPHPLPVPSSHASTHPPPARPPPLPVALQLHRDNSPETPTRPPLANF